MAPRNQERVKDADGNGAAQPVVPVIFRRNRPGERAKFGRQRRPEHDEVEMTGVIGKENALLGAGNAVSPRYLHAADGARDAGDEARKRTQAHRRSKSPYIKARRRTNVALAPTTISTSAIARI